MSPIRFLRNSPWSMLLLVVAMYALIPTMAFKTESTFGQQCQKVYSEKTQAYLDCVHTMATRR